MVKSVSLPQIIGTKWKETSFGGPKEIKTSFFKPVEEIFFSLGPPKEVFLPCGPPKENNLLMGGRTGIFFLLFFWQFFSTCEKITQFLEFCKYQGGKI